MLKKILGFAGKKAFDTITSVAPKVNKTKLDKAKSKLAIATQKTKASTAKLGQTIFESKNKAFKGKDFTFATKKGKSESNKEAYKRIQGENTKVLKGMIDDAFKDTKKKTKVFKAPENFNKGGRVGLKSGTQLSAKQMKIASLAGNKKKIDGPDFKKLRAMKSPMDKTVRKV
ncbi:MAG: hypothetical protein EBR05_11445 [Marivivens sp.]|nr:hypothetical protein [Marivivens sp.]